MCSLNNTRTQTHIHTHTHAHTHVHTHTHTHIHALQSNSGQVGGVHDMNVEPAWIQGLTGKGVRVAVVDDGKDKYNDRDIKIISSF